MITRIWHGWRTYENATEYEQLLREEIMPEIEAKGGEGCRSIQLLRRPDKKEVEFMTIILFDSLETVKRFAGEDFEQAYVPAAARKILKRYDERAQHYELCQ